MSYKLLKNFGIDKLKDQLKQLKDHKLEKNNGNNCKH